MNRNYKFQVAPMIIIVMRYVPKCVVNYWKIIRFNEKESKTLMYKLQIKSVSGTVKICKTFSNFMDPIKIFKII